MACGHKGVVSLCSTHSAAASADEGMQRGPIGAAVRSWTTSGDSASRWFSNARTATINFHATGVATPTHSTARPSITLSANAAQPQPMLTTSKNEVRGSQTERTTSKHGVPDCVPSRGLPSRGLSSRSSGRRCNISVHDWSEKASVSRGRWT